MSECKNCGTVHAFDFQYCPVCGARVVEERLTLRALFKELLATITNLEGPVWNTLRDLTIRPRSVTEGFITGVRMRYLTPIRYLLIAFTFSGLAFVLFQDYFEEVYTRSFAADFTKGYTAYDAGENNEEEVLAEAEAFISRLQFILQKYANLLGFLFIPVFALLARWWLNKHNQYNLAESLVCSTYLYSHAALLLIPAYLFLLIPGAGLTPLTLATYVTILYFGWMVKQAYQTSIWKSLLTIIVGYVVYFFLAGGIIFLYLLVSMLLAQS